MEIEERICLECQKTFKTRSQNFLCPKCISRILSDSQKKPVERDDIRAELGYLPVYKPRKEKTQLEIDAKAASDFKMSYGEYIANVKNKKSRR